MGFVTDRLRRAAGRGRPLSTASTPQTRYQGYVDERSTHHIAGWLRNIDGPAERVPYEVVLREDNGERVLHYGIADAYSDILVQVGVGDGRYAFAVSFDQPLSETERNRVIVRPQGSEWRLELAPELKTMPPGLPTAPPPGPPPAPAEYQGYIDERSMRHVAGWVRDLADPGRRVTFEIVLPAVGGERVLHRGVADLYSPVLQKVGVGDGGYAFYVLLNEALTETERDAVFVRPAGSARHLEIAPALRRDFEPISHIAMDIVNNCNLRCPFCVYDYANTRATKFMSEATFESAVRLLPYVTDGNFWLSCLHEATLHPRLTDFIARVPEELRRKLFYTTNLAKRMPDAYFAFLADFGMHHINVSVESFVPEIYEAMREGARHRIFVENWGKMIAAFRAGSAPPRIRYNIMAYRSNYREIPQMIEVLRAEKLAWQVEVRHTYDEPHIPAEFREREFLATAEWQWLAEQLAPYSPDDVLLLLPPGGVGHNRPGEAPDPATPSNVAPLTAAVPPDATAISSDGAKPAYDFIPKPLNLSMDWDGTLRVYGEHPRGPGESPTHVNYVMTNINYLKDPLRFLLTL